MQWIRVVAGFTRVGIRAAREQQACEFEIALLRCRVQCGRSTMIGRRVRCTNELGILSKQRANGFDVAASTRLEERHSVAALTTLDFGFQRAPTGKAVIARDSELRIG